MLPFPESPVELLVFLVPLLAWESAKLLFDVAPVFVVTFAGDPVEILPLLISGRKIPASTLARKTKPKMITRTENELDVNGRMLRNLIFNSIFLTGIHQKRNLCTPHTVDGNKVKREDAQRAMQSDERISRLNQAAVHFQENVERCAPYLL